ncbi:MAG: aminopeptidase P family protein [Acidobacteria bacterium]|nr:aminopeptidase P family protein [Acidobacteriota bacterium]
MPPPRSAEKYPEPIRSEPLPRSEFQERMDRAQGEMRHLGMVGLFVTPGTNLYYLSGISVGRSERLIALLLPSRGKPVVVCPLFEEERIRSQSVVEEVLTWQEHEAPFRLVQRAARRAGLAAGTIGVEPTTHYDTFLELRRHLAGYDFTDGNRVLQPLRMVKSEGELAYLRLAAQGTQRAIQKVWSTLVPGLRESDLAREISEEMRKIGGPGGGLVQFGPGSAIPHGAPGDRPLDRGQAVLIDVGMRVQGYTSDLTRTGAFKEASDELRRVFDLVLRAQRAGQQAARSGATCESVDAAARKVIQDGGYGPHFTHRLGHGLGLDGHEHPYLVRGNRLRLLPGMTVTIEPGIYLPGKFGIRIEDDFVIASEGALPLSELMEALPIL